MWPFLIINVLFYFSWLNKHSVNCPQERSVPPLCVSLPPGFCFHFLSVDSFGRAKQPSPWLLLPSPHPPKAAWERTWHVPYAVTCFGSQSCWPVCTTSANPASLDTGEELRGLWPARNAAKSSAPSSFRPTTLWQPWWRKSGPPPQTLTSRT